MSEAAPLPYPCFDSDQHYYEPRDCFTRCLAREHQAKAIRVERGRSS